MCSDADKGASGIRRLKRVTRCDCMGGESVLRHAVFPKRIFESKEKLYEKNRKENHSTYIGGEYADR